MKNLSLEELSQKLEASSEAWTFLIESKTKFTTFFDIIYRTEFSYNCRFFDKDALVQIRIRIIQVKSSRR
jgi:hypothetical protein